MHQDMTTVVGLSGLKSKEEDEHGNGDNHTKEQYLYVSKARNGEGGLVPVHRQFGYQKLTDRGAKQLYD